MALRDDVYELSGKALAQTLRLIAQRTVRLVPAARTAVELALLERALVSDEIPSELGPLLVAGFARVCGALGVATDDTGFSLDGSVAMDADAIFWALFHWTLYGHYLDAEVAAESYEDLAVKLGTPRDTVLSEMSEQIDAIVARAGST